MKTAEDIVTAYKNTWRKDNDLIFFLLGGTVSEFLNQKYEQARQGYLAFPCEMSFKEFEDKFFDARTARKIFQRAGFDVTFFTTPSTGHLFWKKPGVGMARITIKR